jgi:hypothetical protein
VSDLASEGQGDQVRSEVVIPSLQCLFKAIQGLVELAHQLRVSRINKVSGLAAVDRFGEGVVEQGVLNIH